MKNKESSGNLSTNSDWSKNTTGNANLAADETIVMENGTYQLIAVTTRDDDVFYVIIDKTKTENNVYFLNEVDTADLDKLAKDDSNVSSGGEDTSEPTTAPDEEAQTTDNTDSTSSGNNQYMIYLVIGIVILGGIGFAFYKLKGKGGKKSSNNESEYTDEDFDYQPEINEDEESESK